MEGGTLPPAWLSPPWAVYRQAGYKGERPRSRLTIYALGHDHSAPILSWAEGGASSSPMGAGGGLRWERVPLSHAPWHVQAPPQPEVVDRPPLLERAEEGGAGAAAWSGVVRGWAAGAALLALLVVIARLAEHFLDWKYLMRRRRMQRDWQRASVRANTRNEEGFVFPGDAEAGALDLGLCADLPPPRTADMPPPYSELSASKVEEPPPPYESESCVQLASKRGEPVLVSKRGEPALGEPAGRRRLSSFHPAGLVTIIADDDELIGEPPTRVDEERASDQGRSDGGASTGTNGNIDTDDDAKDGSVAV